MSFRQSITGVILAGGKGTRMGGQDKGLIPLLDKPLYRYIIERLQPQVGQLMINANRHHAEYAQSQLPVFTDLTADFSGPLAGMQAALHQVTTDWLLFVPCDVPEFPTDLAEKCFAKKASTLPATPAITNGSTRHLPYSIGLSRNRWMITSQEEIAN